MGKVYIGVMAVCGHKLWGGGGRLKIDVRRWEGCGPGMPSPYGVVEGCAGAGRERAGGGVKTPPYDVEG